MTGDDGEGDGLSPERIERLRDRAEKLRALAEDRATTEAEKTAAQAAIDRLLQGLPEETALIVRSPRPPPKAEAKPAAAPAPDPWASAESKPEQRWTPTTGPAGYGGPGYYSAGYASSFWTGRGGGGWSG